MYAYHIALFADYSCQPHNLTYLFLPLAFRSLTQREDLFPLLELGSVLKQIGYSDSGLQRHLCAYQLARPSQQKGVVPFDGRDFLL